MTPRFLPSAGEPFSPGRSATSGHGSYPIYVSPYPRIGAGTVSARCLLLRQGVIALGQQSTLKERPMFQHILVPTDFDEHAWRAFDVAVSLAQKFDGKITLLHVYQIPPSIYSSDLAWPTEQLATAAKTSLAEAVAKAKQRYARTESLLEVGSPGETIVNAATKHNADLIVMATHGRRGIARALLGSVTEKVVRLAHSPVLTVSIKHD